MGRGVHRGFITHEELNKSLGKRNLSDENLSQAFVTEQGLALYYTEDDESSDLPTKSASGTPRRQSQVDPLAVSAGISADIERLFG